MNAALPAETVTTSAALRAWPLPSVDGSKEARGRLLVVGGARSTPGAVLLAAEAGMRAGAGKLQVATVGSTAVPLALALPEAGVAGLEETEAGEIALAAAEQIVELAQDCDAVLLGPGMSDPALASSLLERVIPTLETTVVLDALGMAYLTDNLDGVAHVDGRCVLSPNLGEMARTLGMDDCSDDPPRHIVDLARRTGAVVVSGTSSTWVSDPAGESLWRDDSGGPGLGASGAGDVKAGVIAGLCVRRAEPMQAGVWAAYSHGRAGERLAARVGPTGFLARELLDEIPRVLVELSN
ncbi:NAD(P)H-hydrate dehydratase [Mobilicoccus caccae]|uniref:ADP-dependent (S)-NAD(P)H-hydrate dehydratase n=1 Tax=Mobilicoccus caccae TaxID=1859295 RepID=A0ABQ6IZW0_9MICO|nr:NAD(P)H-hydrate dehydratase [Mobilicoccus caccae]GMA42243.1 ADP-dependent (S)-NAD(P)H-hydrate dehydratase [Mobilicoccus caccae]